MLARSSKRLKLVHSSRWETSSNHFAEFARDELIDGILAILVTDLEGFTPLVERLGDMEAQSVIRTHNALLRACIQRWQGREVAHTGDGIIAAFRSVVAAISCAGDVQRSLGEQAVVLPSPLRARIGIHAGEPLREDDRLFGQCVNTAVRVCGQAGPGRILVTEVIEQLARGRFHFGQGDVCALKGLSSPLRLFCCESTDSPAWTHAQR